MCSWVCCDVDEHLVPCLQVDQPHLRGHVHVGKPLVTLLLQDLHDLVVGQVGLVALPLVLPGNLRHVEGGQVHNSHVELLGQQVLIHRGVDLVLTNIPR